ncbi:DUF3885 domain-containing protein [Kiloniella sp.]|uniref:DUF3885 domain-containing protein n=1 Tax=Kiloniella sp. TaxID=1938587 RepID=UPI003B027807
MSTPLKRAEFEAVFGTKALDSPLFYNHEYALRFNLQTLYEGEWSYPEIFLSSFERAQKIIRELFTPEKPIGVCLLMWGDKSLFSVRNQIDTLKGNHILFPGDRDHWSELNNPDEDDEWHVYRHTLLYEAPYKDITPLLWMAIASDLGVKPTINANIFFFDREEEILAYPYDDRGMDLISPKKGSPCPIVPQAKRYAFKL